MARGVNKVILIGNLGGDPEVRYTPNGSAVCNLSLATSESWKDRQTGQPVERTEWHRIVVFGKLAEIAGQFLRKGSKVYIEGKLQTRKWQDQQGQDRYTTEIVVDINGQLQMLDGRQDGMGGGDYQQQSAPRQQQQSYQPQQQQPKQQQGGFGGQSQQQAAPQQAPQAQPQSAPAGGFDDFDDDIPF